MKIPKFDESRQLLVAIRTILVRATDLWENGCSPVKRLIGRLSGSQRRLGGIRAARLAA